jgi:cellulose synthase/poly-beta-1,6-N-acetylglucosamine synthase-like glycosyltransferase
VRVHKKYLLILKIVLLVVLTLSCLGIAHTYFFYRLLLSILPGRNKLSASGPIADYPDITILLAVFNEEQVIEEKIRSSFDTDYPQNKIHMLVGSDNSCDATNRLIIQLQQEYPTLKLIVFESRQGKIKIMNKLAEMAGTSLLLFTDANVFFRRDTLSRLVSHFQNEDVQLACGNIIKEDQLMEGVSPQEIYYLDYENSMKYNEFRCFGFCLGAEGGCFLIRKQAFLPVPEHFLVDDFFTTLQVVRAGGVVIFDREAICREDSPGDKKTELKRKTRIQIGNMQNLVYFRSMVNPFTLVGFAFISHKILRWFTPILLLLTTAAAFGLSAVDPLFTILGISTLALYLSPVINYLLIRCGLKISVFGFAAHFSMMNWALLKGFFLFFSRQKNLGPWQPTPRKVRS